MSSSRNRFFYQVKRTQNFVKYIEIDFKEFKQANREEQQWNVRTAEAQM